MCGCSATGEQVFLYALSAKHHKGDWKLIVQCTSLYNAFSFQSTVKLEWFMYTVSWQYWPAGTLCCRSGSILVYLNMQFYTQQCLHRPVTHMMHQCGCCGNSARKLRISVCICLHTPVMDTTHQWHCGSYAEKGKYWKKSGPSQAKSVECELQEEVLVMNNQRKREVSVKWGQWRMQKSDITLASFMVFFVFERTFCNILYLGFSGVKGHFLTCLQNEINFEFSVAF